MYATYLNLTIVSFISTIPLLLYIVLFNKKEDGYGLGFIGAWLIKKIRRIKNAFH